MTPGPARPVLLVGTVAVVLVALVAVLTALATGALRTAEAPGTPAEGSVEVGFARDMATHHGQAVEMAFLVYDRTDDPQLKALAYDVATTQENQRGQMRQWLLDWDLPYASVEPVMAWMGGVHSMDGDEGIEPASGGASLMPGMATTAELEGLRAATGTEAEVRFLRLMTVHHRAGIAMASYAAEHAEDPEVVDLARTMVLGQQAEIDLMGTLLDERVAVR